MALQAYIDDSRSGHDVLILAGFISDTLKWADFSKEWDDHLKLANIEEFKMSDFGHRSTDIVASFYRIIEKYSMATIACAIPINPLKIVAAEFTNDPIDANPYIFGFKALVQFCSGFQQNMGIGEPIDFIFDEQLGEQNIIHLGWKGYVDSLHELNVDITGAMPIFRNSKKFLPIQAADLCAWWYRRKFLQEGTLKNWPFPWTEQKRLALHAFSFSEKHYRETFAKSIGEPLKT